jgi:hypothetical protein
MNTFWAGAAFGAGAVTFLGLICRAVLVSNAERHFRAAYIATLAPEAYERLVRFEATGVQNWRQFRDQELGVER